MVVTTNLESKDLFNFSIEEMMGSLISHETRLNLEKGILNMRSRLKTLSTKVEEKETKGEIKEEDVIIMQNTDTQNINQDNHNTLKTHKIKEEEGENG
jgi:hypothetical protein